jgi:hypothetical protein
MSEPAPSREVLTQLVRILEQGTGSWRRTCIAIANAWDTFWRAPCGNEVEWAAPSGLRRRRRLKQLTEAAPIRDRERDLVRETSGEHWGGAAGPAIAVLCQARFAAEIGTQFNGPKWRSKNLRIRRTLEGWHLTSCCCSMSSPRVKIASVSDR